MFRIKSVIILVGFLILGNVAFAKGLEGDMAIDVKVGESFKGIAWVTDISTIQGMHKTGTTLEGIDTYTRDGDDLRFDGMVVNNIEYGFYKGKFCSITFMTEGKKDFDTLKNLVFEKYGVGIEVINDKELLQYVWQGYTANITFSYDYSSGEGTLIIIKMTE